MIMFARILLSLTLAAFNTYAHDTHATSHRCQHERAGNVTSVRCESRSGHLVTYSFTKIVTVRVP